MDVARRFEAAQALDPLFAAAEMGEILRLVPGRRAVAGGRFGGRAAVFRMDLSPAGDSLAREWAELRRIRPQMCDGPCRVAEPLHFSPDHRVLAIARVDGTPLLKHLWESPPAARAAHLLPAARWLRHYTECSEIWRPARADGWVGRAERAAARQPFRKLARLEQEILAELRRLAGQIGNSDWRCAICHGDLHPNNLILDAQGLTGIDTGGSSVTPVYKDMARFVVHMGRRGMIPSGRRYLGVDAEALEAFGRAFHLTEAETGLHLPFMIGCEALLRVETRALGRGRIRRAEAMYAALRDDLHRVGRFGGVSGP